MEHVNKPIETNEKKSFIRSFVCYLSKAQNQKSKSFSQKPNYHMSMSKFVKHNSRNRTK